jgi:hypothetical protein
VKAAATVAASDVKSKESMPGINGKASSGVTSTEVSRNDTVRGKADGEDDPSADSAPATTENEAAPAPAPVTAVEALVQDALATAANARKPEEQDEIFYEKLATSALAVDASDVVGMAPPCISPGIYAHPHAVLVDAVVGGEKRTRAVRTPEPDPGAKRAKLEVLPT